MKNTKQILQIKLKLVEEGLKIYLEVIENKVKGPDISRHISICEAISLASVDELTSEEKEISKNKRNKDCKEKF